jgi:hypothetical protein
VSLINSMLFLILTTKATALPLLGGAMPPQEPTESVELCTQLESGPEHPRSLAVYVQAHRSVNGPGNLIYAEYSNLFLPGWGMDAYTTVKFGYLGADNLSSMFLNAGIEIHLKVALQNLWFQIDGFGTNFNVGDSNGDQLPAFNLLLGGRNDQGLLVSKLYYKYEVQKRSYVTFGISHTSYQTLKANGAESKEFIDSGTIGYTKSF